jgi:hypothetical protein
VGTGTFTWRRLRSYLEGLRWERSSAFWRARDPEGEGLWSVDSYLLAQVVDLLAAANWQRSADGSKGTNRPKPLPRPSDKYAAAAKADLIKSSIAQRRQLRRREVTGERGS